MRAIPIQYVTENSILGEDLYTAEGKILLRKGTTLSSKFISKIEANKVFTVYIEDPHSDIKVNRLLEQSYRIKGALIIKSIFDAAANQKSIFDLHHELSEYADDVLYEIKSFANQPIEYIDVKNVDAYLYSSSLNVALISALISWGLKYNDEMVKHIFIGAIYHDIGIALLPADVINKSGALTTEEKMMIINHPATGYQYIKDKTFISAYVKTIILQHHECSDGTGYPKRIKGDQINKIAQIVGLADIYDAMTSDRPYKRAVSPKEAIEFIVGATNTKFEIDIVSAFNKRIAPYPRGTVVKLSNDMFAVVDELNASFPLRPKIRIIYNTKTGYEYEEIDLVKHQNLLIEHTVYQKI